VKAERGQPGEDQFAARRGLPILRPRPFCRHVLTNIRVRVMMPE
jgi:hypothetical protein